MRKLAWVLVLAASMAALGKGKPKATSETISGPVLVFVDETVASPTSAEAAEGGADMAFYRDAAATFATKNGLKTVTTKAATLFFTKDGGKSVTVKNKVGPVGESYFFDGKKDPKRVEELVSLTNGKEFQSYFGRAPAK